MQYLILKNEVKQSLRIPEEDYWKLALLAMLFGYKPSIHPIATSVSCDELLHLLFALQKAQRAILHNESISLIHLMKNLQFIQRKVKVHVVDRREDLWQALEDCHDLHLFFAKGRGKRILSKFIRFLTTSKNKEIGYCYVHAQQKSNA